jgi:hypothetical protein
LISSTSLCDNISSSLNLNKEVSNVVKLVNSSNNDIESLKSDFTSIQTNIDNFSFKTTVFKVDGNENNFYPIFFNTSYFPYHFFITRDSVHWNRSWKGRLYFEAKGFSSHWGHGSSFLDLIKYYPRGNSRIAKIHEHSQTGIIVILLEGNTSYRFIGKGISLKNYLASPKQLKYPVEPFYYDDSFPVLTIPKAPFDKAFLFS